MKPMLARTYGPKYSTFPCFLQPKLNGERALYQRGVFQSRYEKLFSPKVIGHLIEQLRTYADLLEGTILDGELYVHGWSLQRINSATAVNRKAPTEDSPFLEFHVFDTVAASLFSVRWLDLCNQIRAQNFDHIISTPTHFVHSREEVQHYLQLYCGMGYEGVMLRPDGPYEYGEHFSDRVHKMTEYRSPYLWKYKSWLDAEFLCVGVTQGEGKADIGIGALILSKNDANGQPIVLRHQAPDKAYRKDEVFKVGTGFSDVEREYFYQHKPIGKFVKIRYLNLTDDNTPFNPSFLCVMN